MQATFLPSLSNCTSLLGNSRMMVNSRRAGRVVAPASSISASTLQRTPTSRSVVVMLMPLPLVCSSTLERIGQRRAGADHALDLLQAFEELFFAEMEFHTGTGKMVGQAARVGFV